MGNKMIFMHDGRVTIIIICNKCIIYLHADDDAVVPGCEAGVMLEA